MKSIVVVRIPHTGSSIFIDAIQGEFFYGNKILNSGSRYLIHGYDAEDIRENPEKYWPAKWSVYDFWFGHFPCRFDPDFFQKHMKTDPIYMTMFRDPLDRLLSHFFHEVKTKGNYNEDVSGFIEFSKNEEMRNVFTKWFSFPSPGGEASLGNAIFNIKNKIHEVGIIEEYDKFIEGFNKRFNSNVELHKRNRLTYPFSLSDLSDEEMRIVEGNNRLDIALYESVKGDFLKNVGNNMDRIDVGENSEVKKIDPEIKNESVDEKVDEDKNEMVEIENIKTYSEDLNLEEVEYISFKMNTKDMRKSGNILCFCHSNGDPVYYLWIETFPGFNYINIRVGFNSEVHGWRSMTIVDRCYDTVYNISISVNDFIELKINDNPIHESPLVESNFVSFGDTRGDTPNADASIKIEKIKHKQQWRIRHV